jgi:hypothetical protein
MVKRIGLLLGLASLGCGVITQVRVTAIAVGPGTPIPSLGGIVDTEVAKAIGTALPVPATPTPEPPVDQAALDVLAEAMQPALEGLPASDGATLCGESSEALEAALLDSLAAMLDTPGAAKMSPDQLESAFGEGLRRAGIGGLEPGLELERGEAGDWLIEADWCGDGRLRRYEWVAGHRPADAIVPSEAGCGCHD